MVALSKVHRFVECQIDSVLTCNIGVRICMCLMYMYIANKCSQVYMYVLHTSCPIGMYGI